MSYLAACVIVKNEARYIYEWLSFHYVVGVDKFFIYNNNSDDDTLAVIRRWPRQDRIVVIDWPMVPGQRAAYEHMIREHRGASEWCAFIDCDEFMCPRGSDTVPSVLRALSSECSGLYAQWLVFGSSWQITATPDLVTERFVRRSREDFGPNGLGKSIVKLADASGVRNPHVIQCNGRLITETLEEINQQGDGIHNNISHLRLSINHYFTKSLEEWRERRAMGKADKTQGDPDFRRNDEEFWRHDRNEVIDTRAREIMRVAKRMFY
jgi:glycosyltransferase involved in cell wall biosynthesis